MTATRFLAVSVLLLYLSIPVAAFFVLRSHEGSLELVALDVALSTIPMVLLAAVTWRLVWPRWKLVAKLLIHPCVYAILSASVGHWSVLVAWLHQGVLGLGGHIWFCRRFGFTWYRVEDPERYVAESRRMVGALGGSGNAGASSP